MLVPTLNPREWPALGLSFPPVDLGVPVSAALWTPVLDAIVTDEVEDGQPFIRVAYGGSSHPLARRDVLTVGKRYHVECEMRIGGGATAARVYVGTFYPLVSGASTWTKYTATWYEADGSFLELRSMGSAGYADFRNLHVRELPPSYAPADGDALFVDAIQTARVSDADETSGQLSDTGYLIGSGTWRVKGDGVRQWIECITAGIISRRNLNAYGTWEFEVTHKAGSLTNFVFSSQSKVAINSGHRIRLSNTGVVTFFRDGVGFMTTVAGYVTEDRYKFRVTRDESNNFTFYIIGGTFADWTLITPDAGTNPFTDSAYPDCEFTTIEFDAGDRLYLDTHHAGVIAP
jgi:hypothetical protein